MAVRFTERKWRSLGTGLIAALVASVLSAPMANAEHFEDVREVAALDGVAAAVAYSALAFPDGSSQALLGRADVFADSLASGVLQKSAPLLLTSSTALSQPTEAELERLEVRTVTILGGTSAVSSAVEEDLKSKGYTVRRLSGVTRIETAAAVARAAGNPSVTLLARAAGGGEPTAAFADALAAGAWAAQTGWPVLLTETERLSAPTAQFLREDTDQVWVIGGRAAVSDEVIAQIRALGVDAQRVSGASRFETAVAVAARRGSPSAATASEVVLVDGQGANAWQDGFAAAAYAGRNRAPIVLANSASGTLPEPTVAFLNAGPSAKLLTGWTVPDAQVTQAAEGMGKEAAVTRLFQVRMTGRNVVRPTNADDNEPIWGHGEDEATGLLTMTVDEEAGTIEYTFETTADGGFDDGGLTLRRGAVGERGPVVVNFPDVDRDGTGSGTVTADDIEVEDFTLAELIATPAAFYAELASNSHEDGAVRGQLPSGGEAHLPATPVFTAIETKEKDSWIRVQFSAPVFLSGTLDHTDFAVTINNAPVQLDDSAPTPGNPTPAFKELPLTADTAADSFLLVLKTAEAQEGQTVAVTLKPEGARELANNLGEHPSGTTKQHVTPDDSAKPRLIGVEAFGQSSLVTLLFSEPIYTSPHQLEADDSIVTNRHVVVTSTTPTQAKTYSTSDIAAIAKAARSSRLTIQLSEPVPSGAEVRASIQNGSGTPNGPGRIKDAADNTMAGPASVTTTTRGGAGLTGATATDVIIGGSSSTQNQSQTFSVRVIEDLRPGGKIVVTLPASSSTVAYGSAVVVQFAGAPGLSITPSFAATPPKFEINASQKVEGGTTLSVELGSISVSGTAPTGSDAGGGSLAVTFMRMDSGGTAIASFDRRRGVELGLVAISFSPSTHLISSPAPGGNGQSQVFSLVVRGALTSQDRLIIDLGGLIDDYGVDYATAPTPTITTSPSSTGFDPAVFSGSPGRRQIVVPVKSGGAVAADTTVTVTITASGSAGVKVPEGVFGNAVLRASRVEASGAKTAAPHARTVTIYRDLRDVSVTNVSGTDADGDLDTTVTGWGTGKALELSFVPRGDLGSSDEITLTFRVAPAGAPLSGQPTLADAPTTRIAPALGTATASATAGAWTVRYIPPTSGLESGTPVTILVAGIDTRSATDRPKTAAISLTGAFWKTSSITPNPTYKVGGAPDVTLDTAKFTDGVSGTSAAGSFGDHPGDQLELTFSDVVTIFNAGKIAIDGVAAIITCGVNTTCQRPASGDTKKVLVVVTTPFSAGDVIPTIVGDRIDSIDDFGASSTNIEDRTEVFTDYLSITA